MYCSVDDIACSLEDSRLIDLTSEFGGANQYNETLISEYIDRSSRLIDSYLYGQYHLPIINADDLKLLMPFCVSITLYELFSRKLLEIPELVYQRYTDAISNLEKLRKGSLLLYSSAETANKETLNKYLVSNTTPLFIGNKMRGY